MKDGLALKIRRKDILFWKLRKLAPAVDRNVPKAIDKGASEIVGIMRSLAPQDTGALVRSIKVVAMDGRMGVSITAGDDGAYYARWVEFGTRSHKQGGRFEGTRHPGNAPRPFFYPAYRLYKTRVQRRIARAVNLSARQVAGAK